MFLQLEFLKLVSGGFSSLSQRSQCNFDIVRKVKGKLTQTVPPVPYQTAMAPKASPSQALASWQGQPELGEKGPTLPDRTSAGGVKSRLLLLPSGHVCLASRAVYQSGRG